jgi:two-component system, LytTR family, response regulator
MERMIQTVIADDEPLAREGIRIRLGAHPGIAIAAEACDGTQAVDAITRLKPDLVFLDVQMPGLDGFGVLDAIADVHLPVVIFVTAYDKYAIQAFDVHAVDYLLKPFSPERFTAALQRARDAISASGAGDAARRLLDLLASRTLASQYQTRFMVRDGQRYVFVRAGDVQAFEASGNYIRLRTAAGNYMVRMTMADLEKKLDPARFARIHRSAVVNIDRIEKITPAWHGDFEVRLAGGQQLRLSRNFRDRLLGEGRAGSSVRGQ